MSNPVFRHVFTSDPTALVYNNRVYIYTGHDEAPPGAEEYYMNDWLCFSSADMVNWQEHGSLLKATDFSWASGDAYASKVIFRNDKFYWYVAVSPESGDGKAIGVAISSNPTGPFEDAIGAPLVTHNMLPQTDNKKANLDPTVLVDDDGQAYIFWGNETCYQARLKENMVELDGEIQIVELPEFSEGAHLHKSNGWYYLSYGYQKPEKVAYAMSRSMAGPWEFKGILNELAGNCETNRPAIIEYKGKSYFIYHNGGLKEGGSHRRSVCIDYLFYNANDTMKRVIMTSEGIEELV